MKALLKDILPNPDNPRVIKDYKFKKLVDSIKEFPEMLEKRPVVVDENNMILGGNMRYKAALEAGLKEISIIVADDWTEKQKKEFLIKDNVNYGDWDWDILANVWENKDLNDWGLDVWQTSDDPDMVNKGDENSEWIGMPEFESKHEDIKIIIAFETEEAREQYAKDHNMQFTVKGKKFWSTTVPFKEVMDLKSLKYE